MVPRSLCVLGAVLAIAQAAPALSVGGQAPESPVRFVVASVRPNKEPAPGQSIRRLPGGRLNAVAVSVRSLLLVAYEIQSFQLVGVPGWVATDRFDILATLEGEPSPAAPGSPDRMMLALQTLLAERFTLVVHRETRELDIYALVLARPGTPGRGLRRSTQDCSPQAVAARRAEPPAPADAPVVCAGRQGHGRVEVGGFTMASVLPGLAGRVGRFVVDRTGLDGRWDFELSYAPVPSADTDAPSIFTALQEQLGLRLEPAKGPVDVLVVDRLEPPTAD